GGTLSRPACRRRGSRGEGLSGSRRRRWCLRDGRRRQARRGRGFRRWFGIGEERELELEAKAAGSGAVRIDRRESSRRDGEPPGLTRGTGCGERGDELGPDRVDDLVEEHARVAAAILELVEDPDACYGVARDERIDERADHLR